MPIQKVGLLIAARDPSKVCGILLDLMFFEQFLHDSCALYRNCKIMIGFVGFMHIGATCFGTKVVRESCLCLKMVLRPAQIMTSSVNDCIHVGVAS